MGLAPGPAGLGRAEGSAPAGPSGAPPSAAGPFFQGGLALSALALGLAGTRALRWAGWAQGMAHATGWLLAAATGWT